MRSTHRRVLPRGRREIVCSRAAAQGKEATNSTPERVGPAQDGAGGVKVDWLAPE